MLVPDSTDKSVKWRAALFDALAPWSSTSVLLQLVQRHGTQSTFALVMFEAKMSVTPPRRHLGHLRQSKNLLFLITSLTCQHRMVITPALVAVLFKLYSDIAFTVGGYGSDRQNETKHWFHGQTEVLDLNTQKWRIQAAYPFASDIATAPTLYHSSSFLVFGGISFKYHSFFFDNRTIHPSN